MKKLNSIFLICSLSFLTGCEAVDYAGRQINYALSNIPGTPQQKERERYDRFMLQNTYDARYQAQRRHCGATIWSPEMRQGMGC